ncbi:uncharacterized protein LOC110042142 isoform X1 [Orbicella faveolata]|uniref:uncharacterized protein LOC110042142 isoform X1 n=1 Tax=Orbicella faveolata TaxID=48498 RepID=UPI0009E47848|nr:uncharacterized protein LOC110042142 isoform X1 [Orbicella faveolata]
MSSVNMEADLQARLQDLDEILGGEQGNASDDTQLLLHDPYQHPFHVTVQDPPDIQVEITDLKDVYDKFQIKKVLTSEEAEKSSTSEQRIAQGKVSGVVWTSGQIETITAFVQRTPEAAEKAHDTIGPVELRVSYEKHGVQSIHFSIDLDSVYKTPKGELVYSLDRVEMEMRNMWQLVIVVELIDGSTQQFTSKEFRIRTRPRPPPKQPAGSTDPVTGNTAKRKRPEIDSHMSGINGSPHNANGSSYSGTGNSPSGSATLTDKNILTDYLEAQRALITDLRVVNMTTESADIAYHLNLTESARRRPDLEEGDVIAFLGNAKTGQTEIEKLTHENSGRAVMAGVISRSAYIYAHTPRHDVEKGATETVCVIGLVKVKVLGTVQNGERVYAAVHQPGVAIPETHIPLRAMAGRTPTLLGQALESKTSYKQDSVHLVHCFVSIVLGIQSGQLANAINDLQEGMQGRFEDVMVKNRSKWLKGLRWKLLIFLVVLGLLTAVFYEFLAPGTWYQYQLCKRGSIKGHAATFSFTTHDIQTPTIRGIEFTWERVKKKLDLDGCEPLNATDVHYYLNLDRCAYGERIVLDHKPPIRGPEVFAVNATCSGVFYLHKNKWLPYATAEHVTCEPPYS